MNSDLILTETEMTCNPLFRKMRERFTCSGNMTIGEIMLYRAEKGLNTTGEIPAVTEATTKAKKHPAFKANRRALVFTCTTVLICIAVLLAFIIPIFNNFNAEARGADVPATETIDHVKPVGAPSDEDITSTEVPTSPASTFDNAIEAFESVFGE